MRPVAALSDSIETLRRTPLVAGIVLAVAVLGAGVSLASLVDPVLAVVGYVAVLLAIPFVVGGIVALVADALDGGGDVDSFVRGGRDNYLSLVAGGLLLGVVTFVLYLVVGILLAIVAVFVLGFGAAAGASPASLVAVGVAGLLAYLVISIPWFFSQFFPARMVLDDDGILDSFRSSVGLVTGNFATVIGFDLVALLIGLLAQIPNAYVFGFAVDSFDQFARATPFLALLSTTELAIYLALSLVVGTVVGSVTYTYYVAFYERLPSD